MTASSEEVTAREVTESREIAETRETDEAEQNQSIDWVVTGSAAALILSVVLWGIFGGDSFAEFASTALGYIVGDWGWLYVLAGTVFVAFILFIAFSKFGHIRLGKDNESPEFNSVSWVAMMFAAGMGIGLMFYGVTEPLTYYRNGVPGAEDHDVASSFASTLFHWGLHPWSLYAIVALAIAYSTFRLGRKQLLSSAFIPLIGKKRAEGAAGKIIDIAAIFATVFGTAASLGLGAVQIQSGLKATDLISNPGTSVIVGTIVILGLCFLASAASGVGKGIQYLSNTNMVLAGLLALFVLILGPTVVILNMIPTSLGNYFSQFFEMAARTADSSEDAGEWLGSWTIFYWAWWVSWSPFVGMFLARISRGRSVREFCIGVLLVPAGVSTVWFAIFGGTAIKMEQDGQSIVGGGSNEEQLFNLLHALPGGYVVGVFALLLLGTFFITSADSASTVMASMTQSGKTEAKPWLAAMWGVATAFVGLTLLISGGADALNSLQSVTIVAATPFLFILIALMFAIVKDMSNDTIYLDKKEHERFARQLAIERRMHRDQAQLDARREQMKKMLKPRAKN